MSKSLKLTDPAVDRSFRTVLIVTAAVCSIWTGVVAFETSAARGAVSAKNVQLEAKKSQLDTQDVAYRARRRAAKRVGEVPQAAAYRGTAAFAAAADAIARQSGAELQSIRFGTMSNNNVATTTFVCSIKGPFPTLVHVIDGFSSTAAGVKVTSTDLTREQVDPKTGQAKVAMRIEGKLGQ